jgi:hypothetical protein
MKEEVDVKELMYRMGERHGLEGLSPSSTSSEYMKGYVQGRRTRIEKSVRSGERHECLCHHSDR